MALTDGQETQLAFLKKIAALSPMPFLMGGIAEDALLFGGFSREHEDIDLIVKREGLKRLLNQLVALGYDQWETWGENASGQPFYLSKQVNGLLVDIGVTDSDNRGRSFIEIGHLHFKLEGNLEPPTGYRVYLPEDAYEYPPVSFEGIYVRTLSPLASIQFRAGIASQGSFGELRPKDRASMRDLRARFFPDADDRDLAPEVEKVC